MLLMSFVIGMNAMIYISIGVYYWIIPDYVRTFPYVLGTSIFVRKLISKQKGFIQINKFSIYFSVEFYYLWVVLSYWKRCRNKLVYGIY